MACISIIVPTYNESHYLPGLIQGLRDLLTFEYEIIVVDNGSTDDTRKIADELQTTVISIEKKCSPSVARNKGIKLARTNLLCFLDADILITREWANEVSQLVQRNDLQNKQFLMGDTYSVSKKPAWIEVYWFSPMEKIGKSYLNGGNIITNKSTMAILGGFNESLETGEDVDLSLRAKDRGIEVIFNQHLTVHHEGYPKNIVNFFKRERWHGKGDWLNFYYFKKSKIAQVSLLFGFCYVTAAISITCLILRKGEIWWLSLLFAFGTMASISCASSILKFRRSGIKAIIIGILLYFVYFTARLTSAVR